MVANIPQVPGRAMLCPTHEEHKLMFLPSWPLKTTRGKCLRFLSLRRYSHAASRAWWRAFTWQSTSWDQLMLFSLVRWKLNKMVHIDFYHILKTFETFFPFQSKPLLQWTTTAQLQMTHKTVFHIPVSDKMQIACCQTDDLTSCIDWKSLFDGMLLTSVAVWH